MAVEPIVLGRDRADAKAYGTQGTGLLGKHLVGKGDEAYVTNPVLVDIARPHVMLILGKRGTGKCLDGESLVSLEDGSLARIKDLANDQRKVLSVNENLKMEPAEKVEFFEREVEQLLHVRLRSGKEVRLTPEHPLLTIKGWKPAEELGIGSRIATPRRLGNFGDGELPEHEVKLLAYMIAEGYMKKAVLFSNGDPAIVNEFRGALGAFDAVLELVFEKKDHYRVTQRGYRTTILRKLNRERNTDGTFVKGHPADSIQKRSIRLLLERHGQFGTGSKQRFVPPEILRARKEVLALFLNRLFSCDGSIYRHNAWQISYCSSSPRLIREVQHLLLRFGVLSRLRKKTIHLDGKTFFSEELVIDGENVKRFVEEIGFFGVKAERQNTCLAELANRRWNPNVDTIPREIWDIYRPKSWAEIGRAAGYAYPKAMRERLRYAPSRQSLLLMAEVEQHPGLRALAESDVFWDEIVGMELVEERTKVYDISVPGLHNFVANDIIVHNSFSMGVIAEEIAKQPLEVRENLATIIIDPMGIYWTMKQANARNADLLASWGLKPEGFPVKLFVPAGEMEAYRELGIVPDGPLTLAAGKLSVQDWLLTFGFDPLQPHGICLERAVKQAQKRSGSFGLAELAELVAKDERSEQAVRDAVANRLSAAEEWGILEKEGTPISQLFGAGQITVIDVSHFGSGSPVRNLLVGLLAREVYQERVLARKAEEAEEMSGVRTKRVPMVWLMMDEAHELLPAKGETAATAPLLTLVRQGREPGVSLLFVTQRPNKLHEDALAQADLVIAHALTARADIQALRNIMQTYVLEDIQDLLAGLPKLKGAAIVLDDNSERMYPIQVRPRLSWHAGGSPIAIKKKSLFS